MGDLQAIKLLLKAVLQRWRRVWGLCLWSEKLLGLRRPLFEAGTSFLNLSLTCFGEEMWSIIQNGLARLDGVNVKLFCIPGSVFVSLARLATEIGVGLLAL